MHDDRSARRLRLGWAFAGVALVMLAGAGLLALVSLHSFAVRSGAMAPTFVTNDIVLAERLTYRFREPHDGEIVFFTPPIPSAKPFVKRVVASPGESLRIRGGIVYRNGSVLNEPYVKERTGYDLEIKNDRIVVDGTPLDVAAANIPPRAQWTSPDTVPSSCYLVLGDERNNSEDSHIWGCAQAHGTFASGPESGKPAGEVLRGIAIVAPQSRARTLP